MKQIRTYLEAEGLSESAIRRRMAEFKRQADIAAEFVEWIESGASEYIEGIAVEGYNAKQIKELAPFMNGVGVYNFLITLRENPEIAKKYIAEGFPTR